MAEIKFEIINHMGVVERSGKGWQLEGNRISWNGAEPKYDIRSWSANHEKMGKGITLSEQELRSLKQILDQEIAFLDEDE